MPAIWAEDAQRHVSDELGYDSREIPGTTAIYKDIVVYGKNKSHDAYLLKLIGMAAKNGLVFNSCKCEINKLTIT